MKQLRTTLVLLLLAAIGGLYIYFNERGPTANEGNVVLLRAPRESIQTVRLETNNSGIELKRAGENWQVAPINSGKTGQFVPADPDAVDTLLQTVELVQSNVPVENTQDLKTYGLDKPQQKIVVDGQTIALGNKPQFAQGQIYAKSANQIALVSSALTETIQKPFDDWRDQNVLRFKPEEIENLSVQMPAVKAQFHKQGEQWKMTAPIEANADQAAISSALTSLSSAQVVRWLDTPTADASLEKPIATIQAGDATLTVGRKEKAGYFARNSRVAGTFILPQGTFESLNKALVNWRDRDVLTIDFASASQLTVKARGKSQGFTKKGDTWLLSNSSDGSKSTRVLDLLYWADALRAQEFIDRPKAASEYGLDKPEITLEVQGDDNMELRVGRKNGRVYASTDSGPVFILESSALDATKAPLDAIFATPSGKKLG